MSRLPAVIFVIDPHKEDIALQEANRLHIPVVAVADTNCNPEGIDYLIPGNDDAIKSIKFFTSKVIQACLDGLSQREAVLRSLTERSEAPMPREAAGSRGKAFVSKADAYESDTSGEYRGSQAAAEAVKQ